MPRGRLRQGQREQAAVQGLLPPQLAVPEVVVAALPLAVVQRELQQAAQHPE